MNLGVLLKEKREDILRIAAKHGARNVRVFGSVVR
ncbi:MAG: nucleotidyltransferase, partial [Candidatus Binatia bacterium]|nr:nucleotidyltransferase [Candidatus Binatia bacterium]